MMSTKLRSKADLPLPKALTTPFMSHMTSNGITRPRIRRRIPSLPAVKAAGSDGSAGRNNHRDRKPGSAGSTRSTSSAHSSVSARSTVSAKSSSSTSGRSGGSTLPNGGDLAELIDYDDGGGATAAADGGGHSVLLVNVPSRREIDEEAAASTAVKRIRDITTEEIFTQAQETDGSRVYEIDLHGSRIGRISNLEKFTRVRVVDLSCNLISQIDNLDHCTDLRELKLYDNKLTEISNLENLKELCHLQLQHNKIRSVGKGLAGLKKLQVLRLDSNHLLRVDSRELASCLALSVVDLSNNKLDSLVALSCLPNLEELHVVNNRLRTVADLSRCKKLQEVDLSYNRLTDLSGLKGLSSLTCLHVAHNHLANMKSLGKVKCLQELNLAANRLTDVGHLVAFYPGLQILDISANHIETWQQVCSLNGLRDIVELYVGGNPFCSERGEHPVYHSDLQRQIPTLEILDGAHVKRSTSRPTTPLMRPMSAATVVTARQVENQLRCIESDVVDFEAAVFSKFESLRADMTTLPVEAPSRPASSTSSMAASWSNHPATPGSSRPVSKSGKRSRLQEAQAFAENHFDSS